MLNALWVGGEELNGTGFVGNLVTFASSVNATATAETAEVNAERRFASSVTAEATQEAQPDRQRIFGANVTARATAENALTRIQFFGTQVFVFANGVLGLSIPREFESSVTAQVTATLLPYDELFDADATAEATADPVLWNRVRHFAATAIATGTVEAVGDLVRYRGYGGNVIAKAITATDPDVVRGGVRFAELSCVTEAKATAEESSVFQARCAANAVCTVTAQMVSPVTVNRFRRMLTEPRIASALGNVSMRVNAFLGGTGSATATAQGQLGKRVFVGGSGTGRATAAPLPPRLSPAVMRPAARSAVALAAPAAVVNRRGFGSHAFAATFGTLGEWRLAIKLDSIVVARVTATTTDRAGANIISRYAGEGEAVATAEAQFKAQRIFAADALASVTAQADFVTNIYDDEPDFRTVFVPAQDFAAAVAPQPFVFFVATDQAMQTFTKQPGERLAYDIDFTEWFAQLEGDDIESASAVVATATSGVPADLTIEQPIKIGSPSYRVKVWTEGGIDGVTYKITLTINTEGGRRKEVDFKLRVKEV